MAHDAPRLDPQVRVQVRRADTRGTTRTSWLESRHSFSFADWMDRTHLGFPPLRVLNDDIVQPSSGFGQHYHRDMEIVTYVLAGQVQHSDSAGNHHIIKAGEAQLMRAGSGIMHSEMNPDDDEPTRFLQIWFYPRQRGLEPMYDQITVQADAPWSVVASPERGGLPIDTDAHLLAARPRAGDMLRYHGNATRRGYLFVADGDIEIDGQVLGRGDAALIEPNTFNARSTNGAHVLLFDLPAE